MADVNVNSITGGSGSLPRLAPDLTFPSSLQAASGYASVAFDPSVGLTTALSLTGKFAVDLIYFSGITNTENLTIKLTVDGVVIWNDTFSSGTSLFLTGAIGGATNAVSSSAPFQCNSSLLLEMQTTTDTSVTLNYGARPIL